VEFTDFQTQQSRAACEIRPASKIGNRWLDEQPFGYVGSEPAGITEQ
jgi:hypothetical protein